MANNYDFGAFDTLIILQQCTTSIGSQGQKQMTFEDYRDVYAKIEEGVNERVYDGNLESSYTLSCIIHKVPELTTRWRVVIGCNIYEIVSLDNGPRLSPVMTLQLNAIDG